MKKVAALVLVLVLLLCAVPSFAEEGDALYLGLGVSTSIGSSKDASADKDGTAQVDSAIATVIVDKDGVIQLCIIDAAQTKVTFSAAGVITADMTAEIKTKVEKGTEYGMLATSTANGIGKEIDEQYAGLEAWLVGKTVEDLKAAYEGKDETLVSVCSIKLEAIITALEKAVANALAE